MRIVTGVAVAWVIGALMVASLLFGTRRKVIVAQEDEDDFDGMVVVDESSPSETPPPSASPSRMPVKRTPPPSASRDPSPSSPVDDGTSSSGGGGRVVEPTPSRRPPPPPIERRHHCSHTPGANLTTDDLGRVCAPADLRVMTDNCCPPLLPRHQCRTCVRQCCSVYEFCVACCMGSHRRFHQCAQECRTSSRSLDAAGRYVASGRVHCFGDAHPTLAETPVVAAVEKPPPHTDELEM